MSVRVTLLDDQWFLLTFSYNKSLIERVKAIGAEWQKAAKRWVLPVGSAGVLIREMGDVTEFDLDAITVASDVLDRHIARTMRIMAESGVDAPVWKEWRERHGME